MSFISHIEPTFFQQAENYLNGMKVCEQNLLLCKQTTLGICKWVYKTSVLNLFLERKLLVANGFIKQNSRQMVV
jgi:hypothetical protein